MSRSGFTLVEMMIALSIVAALVAVAFGGLRIGVAAWQRGEDRAETHQRVRGLVELLGRGVGGAFAYIGPTPPGQQPALPGQQPTPPGQLPTPQGRQSTPLFQGEPTRLSFVTVSPPVPPGASVAFTAVTLSLDEGPSPGLAVRQKVLPNAEPFEAVTPVLVDPSVTALSFRYLREGDVWESAWDGARERALPRAVEITVKTTAGERAPEQPPLVVAIHTGPR
jgi:prepilin-type N-terminal cleavage/methylation domain-containing protein